MSRILIKTTTPPTGDAERHDSNIAAWLSAT